MPLEQEIERFPTHAYLDKEKYKDLDRENKIKLREGLFGYFIQQDPARAQEFMSLPSDDERLSVRDAFVAKVTSEVPDLFSVQVKKPQPAQGGRLASAPGFGPAGTMFQGEQTREQKEVRSGLRDSATEMALDMIVDGDMDPSELDFDGAVVMGQFLEERGHIEKAEEVRNRLREMAEQQGIEPQGKARAFIEEAIVEPGRQVLSSLHSLTGTGAVRRIARMQELQEAGELTPEMARNLDEDIVREATGARTREEEEVAEEAFPEEGTPGTLGSVAGLLGATVTGYVGLSRQGVNHFLRRVPESRKYAIDWSGLGKGALIEGMAGAAYSERLPGFAAEMMDQPDNKLLTAVEVAGLGSLFNLGVDAIRLAVRGARTGSSVKQTLSENLRPEQKARMSAKGADVDDTVRTVEEAAEQTEQTIDPSPSRTLSDAQHSIVSYEGYTGTLTELEDGTLAVRTGEGPDIAIEGVGKDWSRTLEDLNVVEVDPYNPRSVTVGENAIKIGDSEFQRPSDLSGVMNMDADGNIISLNLRAMDGSPRTIRTPVEVEQLADVLLDRQIVQSGRAPEILRNLPEPDQNNTRAVRSREFLRNLSKRVNPTSRSVTEAIDVGESVLPDGRLVGGTDDFGRQYKNTLSKRNLRIAKNNIENILEEVQKNKDLRPTRKTKLIRDLEHKLGAIELYEQSKLFPSGVRVGRGDSPGGLEAIREIEGDLTEGAFDAIQRGDFETVATKDLRAAARQVGVRSPSRLRKPELIESLEEALTTPVRSQDAPPIRGWPEPDDTPVQPKSARVQPNDQDFRYTVFRSQTHQGIEIPGGIQIDDMVVPGRITSIDQAHAQGIDLPQPPEWLPQGRYSLGEIRRAIREGPPDMSPGALPDESTIGASQVDDDVAKLEKRVKSRIGDAPPKRAARETARPTATDEVVEEVVEQEKQAKGTQQATNPDGSNAGEVMNGEPSHAAVASGDDTAWRTMQNRRKTLDSRLGIVGMDVEKWLKFMRGWNNFVRHRGSLPSKEVWQQFEMGENARAALIKQQERIGRDMIKAIRKAVKETDWGEDELRATIMDVTKGIRNIEDLPEQVIPITQKNRKFITDNSLRLIDEGVVNGQLADTVIDTADRYLTRSYKAFTQPQEWPKNINPETWTRAVEWIQYNWRDYQLDKKFLKRIDAYNKKLESWERKAKKARAEGKAEPEYPTIKRPERDPNYVPPALTEDEAAIIAQQLIDPNKGGPFFSGVRGGGGQIMGKDVGILLRRKDVPLPIRELLGEITDPVEASLQTTMRHADLIENHKAQVAVRDIGLETGLFSRKRTPAQFYHMGSNQPTANQQRKINEFVDQYGEVDSQPYIEEFMRQENGRYDVWDGLFARQDVFEDFQAWSEWNKPVKGGLSSLYRGAKSMIAGVKFSKTILNYPSGHITNLFGAMNNILQQGHINRRDWVTGVQGVLRESYGSSNQALDEFVQKLTRNGLLNQTINKRDIEQSLALMRDIDYRGKGWAPIRELIRQWKAPDDMAKFVAWLGEEKSYQALRPVLGEEAFEKFIAERVAATQQMYDRVPAWLKQLSQHELGVVNFVSFSYDQMRIGVNTLKIIGEDLGRASKALKAGDSESARTYAKAAGRRSTAFSLVGLSGGEAFRRIHNANSNVDNEDTHYLDPWVAPFFRNETKAFTKDPRETGIVEPQILSYNAPNENWLKILRSGLDAMSDPEKNAHEVMYNELKEMFFGQGMMTSQLAQAMNGFDQYGRKIPGGIIGQAGHFLSGFEPGMMTRITNIGKALREEEGRFGRVHSPENAAMYMLGQRRFPVEVEKSVPDNFRYTWLAYREAESDYQSAERRNVSGVSLWNQRRISNRVREQNFRHMRNMIESLEEYFDYPRYQVDEWLREHARMSNSEIRYVRSGEYQPLQPSEEEATE